MASGSAVSSAAATVWSFNISGSISFGYPGSLFIVRTALGRILRPIQRTLLPDVKEAGQNEHDEYQHFEEPEQFQLAIHHGPWVQEQGSKMKKNKEKGTQKKFK